MRVDREPGLGGIIIEAETGEEAELLAYLWCNRSKMMAFELKKDGLTRLTLAPTPESEDEKNIR